MNTSNKALRHSSIRILRKTVLTCRKGELFFSIWVFFREYYDSQDIRERERLYFYIFSTTSTRFADTQTLARLLLQKAQLCVQLTAGLELRTFGFLAQVAKHYATRPLKFVLSTLALVADADRSMLKTRVTLGNIYLALLNLIKKFMFLMFKDSFPQCLDFHSFFHSFISFHLQEKNKYWFFFCFFFE